MLAFIFLGGSTIGASDSKVVHVYVDNTHQVVPTRAQTVQDLLNRLHVAVGQNDIIEPALNAPILEDNFTVNVYRARPVTVVDGQKKINLLTAQQSPRAIAKQAGLALQPEDSITSKSSEAVLKDPVIGTRLVIDRATPVKLNLYGQLLDIRTHSDTVDQLLRERGLDPQKVSVYPPIGNVLKTGEVVFVTDPGKDVQLAEVPIPQSTEFTDDYNLTIGTVQTKSEGRPGRKVIVYENPKGQPEQKHVLQEVLVDQPVNKVVVRGRKINTASVAGDKASLMAAAGIRESDYYAVDYIISHESHWRPGALNASGCAGLGQACPVSKLQNSCPDWSNDAVCQLRFFSGYAGRYGGWQGAYAFWTQAHWW